MSPIQSLRLLQEPAYVLLGGVLPDDDRDEVRVVRSPESVVGYSGEIVDAVRYFARLRSRDEAIGAIAPWGGRPADLEALVESGTLIGFPSSDESAVRSVLEPLSIVVTSPATLTDDGLIVLLRLDNGRNAAISPLTAAVVEASRAGVGDGVRTIAAGADIDEDEVWRSTIHDLTSILSTGAGHLEEVTP